MAALVLASVAPAEAWQGPPRPEPPVVLDPARPWRVDVRKDEVVPPKLDRSEGEAGAVVAPDNSDNVELPRISLADRIHPALLKLFEDQGLECRLAAPPGAMTREAGPDGAGGVADSIPLKVKAVGEADEAGGAGWIEVRVPDRITSKNPGAIRLVVHDWRKLRARVGAGVFLGSLTLWLSNDDLRPGRPIQIKQPMTLVIAGHRAISATFDPPGPGPFRVGSRPTVRVEIESVDTDDKGGATGPDPGWWLQLDRTTPAGRDAPLVRLPLPMVVDAKVSCVFGSDGVEDVTFWDTIEAPAGFYRDPDYWNDELILQRHNRASVPIKTPGVTVRRHEITTALPACFLPGAIRGEAFWEPSPGREPTSRPPPKPGAPAVAASQSLASKPVLEGLRASTDLPVAGEVSWVWAVVDLGKLKPDEIPARLHAELWKEDAKEPAKPAGKLIPLDKLGDDPAAPGLAIYRGPLRFEVGMKGRYRIKIHGKGEWPIESDEPVSLPPGEWVESLKDGGVSVRVLIEGEAATPFDAGHALKLFTGSQPFWWFWGEPGFEKYDNDRFPEQTVDTNEAMSLRWSEEWCRRVAVRFRGIRDDRSEDGGPTAPGLKYDDARDSSPSVEVQTWFGESGLRKQSRDNLLEDKAPTAIEAAGKDGPRRFFDFHVAIKPERIDPARRSGPRPLLARFAILGRDAGDRPIGRVYSRRFKLAVRSQWDELLDDVGAEGLALIGLVVVILGVLISKIIRRPPPAPKSPRRPPSSASSTDADDYLGGLGEWSEDDEPGPSSPPPRPSEDPGPAAPGPPKPPPPAAPPTSYLDLDGPGPDHGGTDYLD